MLFRQLAYIKKNKDLGKSTFYAYSMRKGKAPTIKFSDLIKLTKMRGDVMDTMTSIESSNSGLENTPINRLRTAVIKIKNLKKHGL